MPSQIKKLAAPDRLVALKSLRLLDTPSELAFDRLSHLAAATVGTPICLISIVDDRRQFFKSAHGMAKIAGGIRETPLSHSICKYVAASERPLVVPNSLEHPLLNTSPAVSELGFRAYLGAPIRSPEGFAIGALCIIDTEPREWKETELELVRRFAELVDTEIALRASRIEGENAVSRLRALVDSSALCFIATDIRGVITHFNAGAATMLGYTSSEMVSKHSILRLHLTEELHRRSMPFSNTASSLTETGFGVLTAGLRNSAVDERDWTYLRKDGGRIPVKVCLSPILNTQGEVDGFLAIVKENSKHGQPAAQLEDPRDPLSEVSRLKSEFLALMSHEFRTPMNGIIGTVELMERSGLTPQQARMTKTISGATEALLSVINNLLDFSMIAAGQLRLFPTAFSLRGAVSEVVSLLAPRFREKGVMLLIDPRSIPDYLVQGDAERLRQILMNLVGNAFKFTDTGVVGILYEGKNETSTEVTFSILVWDTGIGMSPEIQERLFQPFFQAEGGTTRRFGGTGLGLAITKQLLSKMGGEISVTSSPNRGTGIQVQMTLQRITC